jgi:hypothetical protein
VAEKLTSVEIFCSYAPEDEIWLQKLETHLRFLQHHGGVSLWHHRLIVPDTNWVRTRNIDSHLETASIILPLVNANFCASD